MMLRRAQLAVLDMTVRLYKYKITRARLILRARDPKCARAQISILETLQNEQVIVISSALTGYPSLSPIPKPSSCSRGSTASWGLPVRSGPHVLGDRTRDTCIGVRDTVGSMRASSKQWS